MKDTLTRRTAAFLAIGITLALFVYAETPDLIKNSEGVEISVDSFDQDPAIHVVVPGGPEAERSFNILLPEHVTVRARGQTEAKHLYIFEPGTKPAAPHWNRLGNSLSYEADFGEIHFAARATLEADGIRFRYEFENHSDVDYDMASAVTDPRFRIFFYDPRLERTYVHGKNGFVLLASETPERLTEPLSRWLPARYLAQLTTPIPAERVQHRDDGITYYYRAEPVDVPIIATLSSDGKWVAASFARDPGNVWSNPELTCQHVDPQVILPKRGRAFYELKILLFRGSLEAALKKVKKQRSELRESQITK